MVAALGLKPIIKKHNMYSFCIDLDGTLKTDVDFDCPEDHPNKLRVQSGMFNYSFLKRNNVDKFLQACQKKGDLYLTTAAGGGYAKRCLKLLGIERFFDEIVDIEKQIARNWPQMKGKMIWIDNDREGLNGKISRLSPRLSSKEMDIWVIDTYMGESDNVMDELVAEIEKLQ